MLTKCIIPPVILSGRKHGKLEALIAKSILLPFICELNWWKSKFMTAESACISTGTSKF